MLDRSVVREIILEHARSAQNGVLPDDPTHTASHANPTCGDSVEVGLRIENDVIDEIGYRVRGCAICSASASLMTDAVRGLSQAAAREAVTVFQSYVASDEHELPETLSTLEVFDHLKTNPTRRRCALLPWAALSAALGDTSPADLND